MAISITLTIPDIGTDFYGTGEDTDDGLELRDGMVQVWDDLQALKTTLEAVDLETFDGMPTASGNVGDYLTVASEAPLVLQYTTGTSAPHAANHILLGSDPIDADLLAIDGHTPVNYTANTTPPHSSPSHLSAHIAGIDDEIGLIDGINTPGQTHYANLLTGTTPTAGGDLDLGGNDIFSNGNMAIRVDAPASSAHGRVRARTLGTDVAGFAADGTNPDYDFLVAGQGNGRLIAPGNWASNALVASVRSPIRVVNTATYNAVENNTNGSRHLSDEGRFIICQGVTTQVNLPPTPQDGFTLTITNDTTGSVLIAGSGGDPIEGGPSVSLSTRYAFRRLTYLSAGSGGPKWYGRAKN